MNNNKKKYYVNVEDMGLSTIRVTFPKNIFKDLEELEVIFISSEETVLIAFDDEIIEIEFPEYSQRLFIIQEIGKIMDSRGLNEKLIDNESILKSLSRPTKEEDFKREVKLFESYVPYFLDGEDLEQSIIDDLEAIKRESVVENFIC